MSVEKTVEIVVPSSPADREAIFAVIKELSNSLTRQEGEADYRKEALKELSDKYDIDKKYLRQLLVDFHKDRFEEKSDERVQYEDLYEAIIPTTVPKKTSEE